MNLAWYLWFALVVSAVLFALDCRVFYRNASRAEFGWINLLVMFAELAAVVGIVVKGLGP